jgi:murein DD-endopeptidase
MRRIVLILLFTFLVESINAQVQARILFEPQILSIDNTPFVYYEIHLKNTSRETVTIKSIVVHHTSTRLLEIKNETLLNRFHKMDSSSDVNCDLLSGKSAVVYVEYALKATRSEFIKHEIVFEKVKKNSRSARQTILLDLPYPKKSSLVVGAPVEKGKWAAVYEPSWQRGHRRVFYTVDGKERLPGRFAIDFIKMDDKGLYSSGNPDSITNWFGYGTDVLAVADGVVVAVDTTYSESLSIDAHKHYPFDKATGNYVALDIGGYYAFYEHLKPNSIQVKVGDKVKKGTVLASLGFTGNTTGPHLHFHIANKNSPLGAESIPYVFEEYTYLGGYDNFNDFGNRIWKAIEKKNPNRKQDRPAPNTVIEFK